MKQLTIYKQDGVVLIVTLVLMVALTLIATVGMNSMILQEQISSNIRNRSVAFQAAEAGLKDAADILADFQFTADTDAAKGIEFDGARAGFYDETTLIDTNPSMVEYYLDDTNWCLSSPTTCAVAHNGTTFENTGAVYEPRYIVKYKGEILYENDDPLLDPSQKKQPYPATFFQVTARGEGGAARVNNASTSPVILQMFYVK